MKTMSKEERQSITISLENCDQEIKLSDKDRKILQKISKYIQTFPLSEFETEEIRKELIGMASQAELRGETLEQAIGTDYKTFCNEMITASTEIQIPVKHRQLRVTGTLLIIGGIFRLLLAVLLLIMLMVLASWGTEFVSENYSRSWMYASVLFAWMLVTGTVSFYGGRKGRIHCGYPREAGRCFRCGVVLLAFQTASVIFDFMTVVIWNTQSAAEVLAVEYCISLIFIYTVLILYTTAAWQNSKTGGDATLND